MDKIWEIKSYQEGNEIKIDDLLSKRDIKTGSEKRLYLEAGLNDLSDPYLLPGMEKAVKRIESAVKNKEKILIYGDYDVDGITSTAVFGRFFKKKYDIDLEYFLPDRIEDGYGLNTAALKKIAACGVDLIITVDCGINAFKEAEFLGTQNIDLIITDHHTPEAELPQAAAVINHHLVTADNYQGAGLAGVGTALKVVQALDNFKLIDMAAELLPLTALGTVADLVPLKKENRILVKKGLTEIEKGEILGLQILIEKLKITKKKISAGQVGFIIAPPLNAAGRIADPKAALRLLLTDNSAEAEKIADKLIRINKERRQKEDEIYQEAEKKLKNLDLETEKAIILADSNWHPGIIGISASRLLEKYHLPVILFAVDNKTNKAKGSARSISSLNIYQALKLSADNLLSFGGHKSAAGLSIAAEKIAEFKKEFSQNIKNMLEPEDFLKKKKIDLNLSLKELSQDFIQNLEKLRPFGIANPAPSFIFQNLKTKNCYQMGRDNKHLKLYLNNGIQAVAFNLGDKIEEIKNSSLDLIAEPEINCWQGRENIQLKVKDYRLNKEISTALIFKANNYIFYDYRNFAQKYLALRKLLAEELIKKAAVYINNKKARAELAADFPNHYFFGSQHDFQTEYSHLIIYSLPFSLADLKSILADFNINFKAEFKKIILLFNRKDIRCNKRLIDHKLSREIIKKPENELDFKASIRYNKLSERREKFKVFKNLIFKNNLFALIEGLVNFEEDKNEFK